MEREKKDGERKFDVHNCMTCVRVASPSRLISSGFCTCLDVQIQYIDCFLSSWYVKSLTVQDAFWSIPGMCIAEMLEVVLETSTMYLSSTVVLPR